ncbi:MAG: hypothetical protein IJ760_07865 [Bacteroidales bacterium]|nr:hypothetical protein [Bacteroidales bacterium]
MKRTIIATLALATLTAAAHAQQDDDRYNESVVVKGTYKPVIEQAEKLNFPPAITDTLGRIGHSFQYSINPTRLSAKYEPSRIRAARVIGEPATKLYNNYFRLGFGNYWSPLADLYWCSTRDRLKTYGIRVNHLSSWGSLTDYGPNHFGRTTATAFGKYIVGDVLQLSADLGYEHDHNLYYGFTDSTLLSELGWTRHDISTGDYRASYNVASFNFGLKNMELDPNKLGYTANVQLTDIWGVYGQNELNLRLEGDVHYGFSLANRYKGVVFLHADWDAYANRFAPNGTMPLGYGYLIGPAPMPIPTPIGPAMPYPTDTANAYRNIVRVNPYADFMLGGLQFHAGLTTACDGYTDSATLRIYPDVVVSKKLLRDRLVLSLGATGGLEANSINSIRLENPYITPNADLRATSHYDFSLHGRWTLSKKLEANAEVRYSIVDNLLSFRLDPLYGALNNVFNTLYYTANQLTAGGDITFVNDEMITLRAGGHYYHYDNIGLADAPSSNTTPEAVSYRPDWDATLAASVNYLDKWFIHLEGQLLGKMQAGTDPHTGETVETPLRYGISAEVEYRHNRALSFFLRMDNLAFQRYMLWQNYPSQRGLFILGLTYTIPNK